MKIIVEAYVPFIKGVLESAGHEVTYLKPEEFDADSVKDADTLLIRTRTKCNANLLDCSKVKHIVTATIGTDHIDLNYCAAKGIRVTNAPGCNAPGVAQYVLSTIGRMSEGRPTVGIIGVGHVGSIVERWAKGNGYPVLLNDPPKGLPLQLPELLANSDVVTIHTPLDETTRHMVNEEFLSQMKPGAILINAARGAIVDTPALIEAVKRGQVKAVIDCWEGEPEISSELLELSSVATPHVAGYSAEGKRRATVMAVKALDPSIEMDLPPIADCPSLEAIVESYDPFGDTEALKSNPQAFEDLRNHYNLRSEPS